MPGEKNPNWYQEKRRIIGFSFAKTPFYLPISLRKPSKFSLVASLNLPRKVSFSSEVAEVVVSLVAIFTIFLSASNHQKNIFSFTQKEQETIREDRENFLNCDTQNEKKKIKSLVDRRRKNFASRRTEIELEEASK